MCVVQAIMSPKAVIHLSEESRFWEFPGACIEAFGIPEQVMMIQRPQTHQVAINFFFGLA